METKDIQQAQKMNILYKTLMQEQDAPCQKYEKKRAKIANNLKAKEYWPEGMKHPDDFRGFYWTNDMSFCGFATVNHQEKTVSMIKKALDARKDSKSSNSKRRKSDQHAQVNRMMNKFAQRVEKVQKAVYGPSPTS